MKKNVYSVGQVNAYIKNMFAQDFMMQHKYPFTALHFTLDSTKLDVNVHPAKLEVRFEEENKVFQY